MFYCPTLNKKYSRFLFVMLLFLFAVSVVGCSLGKDKIIRYADYGTAGSDFALELARSYPYRSPGSDQEKAAALMIASAFEELGFQVQIQEFDYRSDSGQIRHSQNIICRLEGSGFIKLDAEGKETSEYLDNKWSIVGAHYDVLVTGPDFRTNTDITEQSDEENGESSGGQEAPEEAISTTTTEEDISVEMTEEDNLLDKPGWQMEREIPIPVDYRTYDGINNNASGVACVLSVARAMRDDPPGFDTVFVLFGAGTDNQAGAKTYLSSLDSEERATLEAMYNVEAIFAGDKVYAHAGTNSVRTGNQKDYHMRRKLYEATDVFYHYRLNTNNGYSLYTNQSTLRVNAGLGGISIFSEWTSKVSDHTPFDLSNIPVVYFESGEYNINDLAEVGLESRNPSFSSTEGRISGTPFDSSIYLTALFMDMAQSEARDDLFLTPSPQPFQTPSENGNSTINADNSDTASTAVAMRDLPRLEQRINNTAFIIVKAMQREPAGFKLNRK
ncbi:MAG: M28 family peptidase [Saccharofermentanales bacterium]|jgi:hypothetical protein